jgi:hypothetical protein
MRASAQITFWFWKFIWFWSFRRGLFRAIE